jgi:hypothetical protein
MPLNPSLPPQVKWLTLLDESGAKGSDQASNAQEDEPAAPAPTPVRVVPNPSDQ